MKKSSFIFYLLSFFLGLCYAQNQGNMQTLSIPDGLSSPNVQSIYQDRFGYIWIMTEDGLNRYDGNKIKIYRNDPDNPNSLFANTVYSATEDQDGYLWIGGIGIASKYDYASGSFQENPLTSTGLSESERWVISMFTDSKGRIWCGTSGGTIHKFDNKLETFELIYHVENIDANYIGEIWHITELKNGKILFANRSLGIQQYDESSGKLMEFLLDDDFSPTKIFRIQEDDDGTIWFSGEDQIIHYNPNFYSYEILDAFQVQSKMYHIGYHKVSDDNYLFISEPVGLIRYNPKTSKVIETIHTIYKPYWFISDKYGIIWIAAQGGIIKYDPNSMSFEHIQTSKKVSQNNRGNVISQIILDSSDKESIWSLPSDNSIVNYNLQSGNSKSYQIPLSESYKNYILNHFIRDKNGNFYFGINNSAGLLKYNLKNNKVSELTHITDAFKNGFRTQGFAIDQNDNLFIASNDGLVYTNLKKNDEYVVPTIVNRRYSSQLATNVQKVLSNAKEIALITKADETKQYSIDFTIEKDTHILIHCLGEGILDRGEIQLFDYGTLSSASGNTVFSMQNIFKTFNAGGGLKNRKQFEVLKLEKGTYNLKYAMDAGHSYNNFNVSMPDDSSLYGIQVYQIAEDSYNALKKQLTVELNDSLVLPIGGVDKVAISRKYSNSVYVSSMTRGLLRYNIQDRSYTQYTFGEFKPENQKNFIDHTYEDISGNLWISTPQGLILLNPNNGKWRVFTEKDGLPSNNILKTIEDKNGELWVISLGGLSKFNKNDPADMWNFVNYDTRDGLTGYSFRGDPIRTPDGEILFIIGDAIHRFKPGKSNTVAPDVIIDDLKISDQSIYHTESPLKLTESLMEIGNISLPYDMNDLSFNFNVVHYSRPYKNRVFYKLEGFNEDWIEPELNTATFTNLEPGAYEFKVKGISADGIHSEKEASIKIEISPPWWRTTFAYILYILIFAAIIFAIDRIQRRRVLIKERAATAIKEAELRAQLAESENERKSQELEEARQLQLSMLPKELPQLPNLDIAVYMQTATEVGGDYYDFHVELDGTLTVVIGDATGHGMRAGTMVTTVKSLFKSHASNPDILFSFQEISRCIKQMNFGKLSMCMTMLKIKGNKMQISTAGMPPSFIFRRDTRVVEEHLFKAMPLGTMEKFPYEIKDTTLKAGDTILLMSDGLPELENAKGEMYGYKKIRNGFEDVAEKSSEDIISYLKNEGASWVNNADPDDDVTFVVIKVK